MVSNPPTRSHSFAVPSIRVPVWREREQYELDIGSVWGQEILPKQLRAGNVARHATRTTGNQKRTTMNPAQLTENVGEAKLFEFAFECPVATYKKRDSARAYPMFFAFSKTTSRASQRLRGQNVRCKHLTKTPRFGQRARKRSERTPPKLRSLGSCETTMQMHRVENQAGGRFGSPSRMASRCRSSSK